MGIMVLLVLVILLLNVTQFNEDKSLNTKISSYNGNTLPHRINLQNNPEKIGTIISFSKSCQSNSIIK